METAGAGRRALVEFLGRSGLGVDDVTKQVSEAFGTPAAIVASGSVAQGFGNADSDIDLYVVVDAPSVSGLPIPTFAEGTMIDTVYHRRVDLGPLVDSAIGAGPAPSGGEQAWLAHRRGLDTLNRFALGVELQADEASQAWLSGLRDGRLQDTIAGWWDAEATRRHLAARWMLTRRPLAASQQYLETIHAALERRCTVAGQWYFTPKWIFEKLAALSDDDGREVLRDALRLPVRPGKVVGYAHWAEEVLERLDAGRLDGEVELWWLPGTEAWTVGDRTLVARWGMRGAEVEGATFEPPGSGAPAWRGPAADVPSELIELFSENLLWLAVTR